MALKRKLQEEQLSELPMPAHKKKRQKCSDGKEDDEAVSSSVFLNTTDHGEFVSLFKIMRECDDMVHMTIPKEIVKQMAEFAIGFIEHCANTPDCGREILILPKAVELYDCDPDNAYKSRWKHCSASDQYWCHDCMDQVVQACDCLRLYYEPTSNMCPWCKGTVVGSCRCFRGGCSQCDVRWCSECFYNSPWNKCKVCRKKFCHECGKWESCPIEYTCPSCADNAATVEKE